MKLLRLVSQSNDPETPIIWIDSETGVLYAYDTKYAPSVPGSLQLMQPTATATPNVFTFTGALLLLVNAAGMVMRQDVDFTVSGQQLTINFAATAQQLQILVSQ